MSGLFTDKEAFNADISGWDVSRITNMAGMFYEASTFNQLLNGWDVSSVTEMKETFLLARAFNRPLNAWDVSSVTDMQRTFFIASSFNTPLDNWNVSSVMNMIETFREASSFNQNLCAWGEKMNAAPRTEPVFFMFRDSGCESELDPLYASTPYENLCTSVCNTRCSPSWYNDCDDQLSLLHSALRGEGKTKDTNLSLK
jgi:surface protein